MPIYEYHCSSCGFQKEYLRKLSDPLLRVCPECRKETFGKMLTAAAFQLKGSGWYVTDFKNIGAKPEAKIAGKRDAAGKTGHKDEHKAGDKAGDKAEHKVENKAETTNESKSRSRRDGKSEARPVATVAASASAAKAQ